MLPNVFEAVCGFFQRIFILAITHLSSTSLTLPSPLIPWLPHWNHPLLFFPIFFRSRIWFSLRTLLRRCLLGFSRLINSNVDIDPLLLFLAEFLRASHIAFESSVTSSEYTPYQKNSRKRSYSSSITTYFT